MEQMNEDDMKARNVHQGMRIIWEVNAIKTFVSQNEVFTPRIFHFFRKLLARKNKLRNRRLEIIYLNALFTSSCLLQTIRACLHEGGGPHVGEVSHQAVVEK